MNVLSLFDGMSGGQIALKQLGIIPDKYYASEIDKHAMRQTMLNFPDTIQLGSVLDVDVNKLDNIDMLIGGSPCTNFSFAGKRNGMNTTCKEEVYTLDRYLELKKDGFKFEGQSYLFWEYMRILEDIRKYNPDVLFLLENVEMGKKWERVLSDAIGIRGVHINSALVSAQNRKRIYWTNIRTRQDGLFGDLYSDIPQPEDRGIFLRDILEENISEKYNVSQAVIDRMKRKTYSQPSINPDKAGTLNTKNNSGQDSGTTFVVHDNGRLRETNKANCVDANYWKGLDNHGQRTGILQRPRGNNKSGMFECKTPTLSANAWEQNNFVISGTFRTFKDDYGFREIKSGKGACVTARARSDGSGQGVCKIGDRIRRLTPLECSRLQTIPDWYKWECSDTQQYRMLGNGWNIETIVHIFSFLPDSVKNK